MPAVPAAWFSALYADSVLFPIIYCFICRFRIVPYYLLLYTVSTYLQEARDFAPDGCLVHSLRLLTAACTPVTRPGARRPTRLAVLA